MNILIVGAAAVRLRNCRHRWLWRPHTRSCRAGQPTSARRIAAGRNAARGSTSGFDREQSRAGAWFL